MYRLSDPAFLWMNHTEMHVFNNFTNGNHISYMYILLQCTTLAK